MSISTTNLIMEISISLLEILLHVWQGLYLFNFCFVLGITSFQFNVIMLLC